MRKNIIIVITLGILIGYLFGHLMYVNYEGIEYKEDDGNIYYVQYGVYTNYEAALSNSSKLDNYKIIELDDKYYVYLGITTSFDNALKIKNLYLEKDIHTYIRSDYVNNSETLKRLKEYDLKLCELEHENDIQSVIKEIFLNQEISL